MEIIPQNFSSLGLVVSEELGNKQTNKFTEILLFYEEGFVGHPVRKGQKIRFRAFLMLNHSIKAKG